MRPAPRPATTGHLAQVRQEVPLAPRFAELKKETGAQLIAGAADRLLVEGGYYPGQEQTVELRFPPVKVDRTVGDGDTVTLGDITITAHATPGHTPGCTTWTMNVREGNEDHTAIFFCSATVALNTLVGNPTYLGIVDDYRKSFERLRDVKGRCIPGTASGNVRHDGQAPVWPQAPPIPS
jgi:glyoxylase-like metal-dependent hydrolase (beta-lactamase superfamily II)